MNIKNRFSVWFSLFFSLLLALVLIVVYTLFADFRKEEFKERLKNRAVATIRLLSEEDTINTRIIKQIDRNGNLIHRNEDLVIINGQYQLIYSTLDSTPVKWRMKDLKEIEEKRYILKTYGGYEAYGVYERIRNQNYFLLFSARDRLGNRKLIYLKYLLLFAFFSGGLAVWILSFRLSKKVLAPLEELKEKVFSISEKNLDTRIEVKNKHDEIGNLANSFNEMLGRINKAYDQQKVFTANASHELRTPITRIVTILENLANQQKQNEPLHQELKNISEDVYQLSDVVTSLLILSKIESKDNSSVHLSKVRIDEVLFACAEDLQHQYSQFKFAFEIKNETENPDLEIYGDETLIKIVFTNLLKNAYQYSSDARVICEMNVTDKQIMLSFTNFGVNPSPEELPHLFATFKRGANAAGRAGTGLGLSIVKRILDYHNADISFRVPSSQVNRLILIFYK